MRPLCWTLALVIALASTLIVASVSASGSAAPAASPTPTAAAKLSKWQQYQQQLLRVSAPADEYFGRLKLSYLGMNNTFRDAAISAGDHTTDPAIANKVATAEDALEAWATKYPRDPQLARTYYLATVVERKIWLRPNQDRAWVELKRLIALFPDTYFGKLVKRDVARGYTEHVFADPDPCPTPAPTPTPRDVAEYLLPFPQPTASPVEIPTPTPLPSPTALALEPGRSLLVLPQPCVTPTPSPSPSPSPSPNPAQAATPGS